MKSFIATFLLLLLALPAFAQERILSYHSDIQIQSDGSLDVREHIKVRAEGNQIRRGITRDLPTRYKDKYGNSMVVEMHVIDVLRDDKIEPWFIEQQSNGVRINIGNDDLLPVPAEYTYTLHYRATRQLGFFADHDELYWNAIGTGWDFTIESGSADVHLPRPIPVAQMAAEGYTGAQDGKGRDWVASLPEPGHAHWDMTRQLLPHEGMTVVLSFPKGIFAEPTRTQRIQWLLKDNRGVLIALLGLMFMLGYCLRRWIAVGRDPRAGIVITRYDPPAGYSPAALRFIKRMGHDNRAFSADVLALAVAGCLRIERTKEMFKDEWTLVCEDVDPPANLPASERILLDKLFDLDNVLILSDANASTMQAAQLGHNKTLVALYDGKMFKTNGTSLGWALLILALTAVASFWIGGGTGLVVIIPVLILMLAILVLFGFLVSAPTVEGRKMLDEIEGLRRYLSVAERNELANLPDPSAPPMLDAKRYEFLLPYAVALEVEDAWAKKFTLAVGAAAAAATTAGIAWYSGGGMDSLGSLSQAVGNSLSSQIASSSSPPGSSSGSGGGGSSGGGGGGGGGGGR
ncbi:MAG: DUF2207 domain-containing protein [Thermomonas sp.]